MIPAQVDHAAFRLWSVAYLAVVMHAYFFVLRGELIRTFLFFPLIGAVCGAVLSYVIGRNSATAAVQRHLERTKIPDASRFAIFVRLYLLMPVLVATGCVLAAQYRKSYEHLTWVVIAMGVIIGRIAGKLIATRGRD